MTNHLRFYIFLSTAAAVAILSFLVVGPFNMHIDGGIYVTQIDQFESGQLLLEPHDVALRAFKPFVGIWGSLFVPYIKAMESLQLLNLLFLFALPFTAFKFFNELGFTLKEAFWGALWILSGYPVLKYGLAISTDMGSWFFALLSAYMVLKGVRIQSVRPIILASLLGFIGGTIKEPGVFGLLFGGLYILFTYVDRPVQKTLTLLSALVVPALVLEISLIGVLIHSGFPTFLDWYGVVSGEEFRNDNYQLIKLAGVAASTFSMLIVYTFIGVFALLRKRVTLGKHTFSIILSLLLASLPVLLWKIFISRVLYIQFLFFVPMALLGARAILQQTSRRFDVRWSTAVYLAPIVCAIGLFLIARDKSLFTLFL